MINLEQRIYPNGLDGRDGSYLRPPLGLAEVARLMQGRSAGAALPAELADHVRRGASPRRALAEGRDPRRLDEAGWAVIFPAGRPAEPIREALAPLLALRREQATRLDERLYREIGGDVGYRSGETKTPFLARLGAGPGPVDPTKLPYYLLLVGDPEAIPYRLQYQLSVQHAVGRLCFETPAQYRRYAESVIRSETAAVLRSRRVAFFSPSNPGDEATRRSAHWLVPPLADGVEADGRKAESAGWQVERVYGEGATRARLAQLLAPAGGPELGPAVLFAATHGVGFAAEDPLQAEHQGALVCQDWPGPEGGGLQREHWLAAEDVEDAGHPAGLIAFLFACYGAGTPRYDELAGRASAAGAASRAGALPELARHAFVSRLPQRLLSHPRGGALAVVGHVERAWDYSFLWEDSGSQTEVFASTLRRLLAGHPVGSALTFFGQRYAELEATLREESDALNFGKQLDEELLARLWIAARDARNYTLLGDPAVRLR
jgi:hypothetical protein